MTGSTSGRGAPRGIAWRLFVSVWLVYGALVTTNVVRETYLAITLGSRLSVRVDDYLGLHPDLFEIPGRGAYINNNPGASILGAIPYGILVRPAIALLTRLRPEIAAPKPPATYDDPRPNRMRFMNAARARGLDVVLGLAAVGIGVTLMAPLAGLSSLLMFGFLRHRVGDDWRALWLAILFAFGTPMLFRSAFLNQNEIIAHLVFAAYVLMVGLTPRPPEHAPPPLALAGMGALLGYAVVCDYSGAPLLLVFGLWVAIDGWKRSGGALAVRQGATFSAGALIPIGILLGYQWAAFGNPIWPAQRYMPPTEYSVQGWFGFSVPTWSLLAGNLVDPRYGLFAFCPLLIVSLGAPWLRQRESLGGPSLAELRWIFAACAGLYLFSSANQFANLQWNTGVRYMVPAGPLLYVAAVPVLRRLPRAASGALIAVTVLISLAVAMARESVPRSLGIVLREGPLIPVFTVLRKTASGYPSLPGAAYAPIAIFAFVGVVVWLVWRGAGAPAMSRAAPPR